MLAHYKMCFDFLLPVLILAGVTCAGFFLFWRIWRTRKDEVILFIDAPDPDNPAAAVGTWRHILQEGKNGRLHIVLTGRPVDLRTAKRFQTNVPVADQIQRRSWETENSEHAERVLEDAARRLSNYLHRCGVPRDAFVIYHGGIALEAPMSDVAHDWDFLFDRKDLVTAEERDEGEIVEPSEYQALVSRFSSLSGDEREAEILSVLRRYPLVPLDELRSLVNSGNCRRIKVFLGGPATALMKLFSGRNANNLQKKVTEFYGMFGALRPGKTSLFPNQFNVACDPQAASETFCTDAFAHVDKFLVPTETCKHPSLVVSAAEMERSGVNSYVVRLQRLWESTHRDAPQPLFDLIPVMAAMKEYRDAFTWVRKEANLQQEPAGASLEVFRFTDNVCASVYVSEEEIQLDRKEFLQFLAQTWSVQHV